MNRKGINYDVGTATTHNSSSRETFDPRIVRREIEIIRRDLHCTAIRISGRSIERLTLAAQFALEQELEVWLSPAYPDATAQEMLAYLGECAQAAEKLRQPSAQIVMVTGTELSAFMRGLVEGETQLDRLDTFMNPLKLLKSTLLKGSFHKNLNAFLRQAAALIRERFHGQLSYASGPWEEVDWTPFDFVGVDYYRDSFNKRVYEKNLGAYSRLAKPVVITEFGSCTYQGAGDKGGYGWAVVDWKKTPPQLKRELVRDEKGQADYIVELLDIFKQANVDGAFVFSFVSPGYTHSDDPLHDLDMASYSVVKSYADRKGVAYNDMPWEPKESFRALAEYYAHV